MQTIVQGVAILRVPMIVRIIAQAIVGDYVDLCVATPAVLQVGNTLCFLKSENQQIAGKREL